MTLSYFRKLLVVFVTIVLVTVITLLLLIKPYRPTIVVQPAAGGQSPSDINQSAKHLHNIKLDLQKPANQSASTIPSRLAEERLRTNQIQDPSDQVVNNNTLNLSGSHVDVEVRHRISVESIMPFRKQTLPAEEILRQNWTNQIQDFLRSCSKSSPVTVVAANYPYRDVVINWLIAARVKVEPPLENILVISFDSPLHELLQRVGIKSVGVFLDSLFIGNFGVYNKLLMARITILRLINYWGYDVAHYDTDAIILKNPLSLYNKHADSDVVGSTGTFPKELGKKWGFTLCMGAILFRSTPQTGI